MLGDILFISNCEISSVIFALIDEYLFSLFLVVVFSSFDVLMRGYCLIFSSLVLGESLDLALCN